MLFYIFTVLLLNGWHLDCQIADEHICRATYYEQGRAHQTLFCTKNENCLCFDAQSVTECGVVDINDTEAILKKARECCK